MSISCPGGFVYIVMSGDTMFRLARRFGITLEALIAANPQVEDPNRLNIGQQLCIPTQPGTPPEFPVPQCPNGKLYTVQKGDTLFLIAQKMNVSLQALIAANPQLEDPNLIFPGQLICIPSAVPPCTGQLYTVQQGDTLFSIAQRFGVSLQALIAANPQITDPNVIVPGQVICIPSAVPPCTGQLYTVQQGDTLFSIAQRFGVSLQALIAANPQITDPNVIVPGQVICIPSAVPPCVGQLYTVQQGDTLFSIAQRFGVSLQALIVANPQITDPNVIVPGQIICIPSAVPPCTGQYYKVQQGDTLFSIAQRFGVSLQALIAANPQITDPNLLIPGQVICIPREVPVTEECTFLMDRLAPAPVTASAEVEMDFQEGTAEVTAIGLPPLHSGRCYLAWFMLPGKAMKVRMEQTGTTTYQAMFGPVADLTMVERILITAEAPTALVPCPNPLFSARVAEKCPQV